ncbi:tyrosine-protein phosphatase non-receptor type 9-like [Cydia pomonella]|uniref:tyrosine-protein phosphatase non-receptor type 9-like n=1 Tax=Cydia pomonella TaxID=82600 RepID=UPI002ADDD5A4|nr:tyrosine-protein phosphatase non-receptor type 9-like [Cydia pomonella]
MADSLSAIYGARSYMQRSEDPKYGEKLVQEYLDIINTPIGGTSDNFRLPQNKNKNRSLEYPCWDISRVVLKSYHDSDYINASYVRGYDFSCKFIATQEPMTTTFDDFWSMVWQENSRVIVMLNGTKSETPSVQYFPSNQDHIILKEFIIKTESIRMKPQYIGTKLTVIHKQTGDSRTMHHFKYLEWLENAIPDPQLFLEFLLAVNTQEQQYLVEAMQANQSLPGPIVVHSDLGIGRTAAYCVIDMCLYHLVHTASVSVPMTVLKVRQQRNFSIQTPIHYFFINNILLYFLATIKTDKTMYLQFRLHFTKKDLHLLSLN